MSDGCSKVIRTLTVVSLCGAGLLVASAPSGRLAAKPAAPATKPAAPAAPAAVADPAYAAFERRDYAEARRLAEEAAARGEPPAHTLLGQIYEQGLGLPRDYGKAAEWYAKGASLGDPHAQFSLGMMLAEGLGVSKNKKQAAQFFELAAAKNHAHAQYNLALLYAEGAIYPQDFGKVAFWLEKAAAQGHAQAEYDLGSLYASGTGTPKDEAKAAYWIGLAAKEGLPDAELEYAVILLRSAVPPKTPPTGGAAGAGPVPLSEAERRSRIVEGVRYLRTAAEKGNPVAQNRLAKAYVDGFQGEVERDPILAAKWHLIARASGATDGRMDLFVATLTPEQRAKATKAAEDWRMESGQPAP